MKKTTNIILMDQKNNKIKLQFMKKIITTIIFCFVFSIIAFTQDNIGLSIEIKQSNEGPYVLTTITNNNADNINLIGLASIGQNFHIMSNGLSYINLLSYDSSNNIINTSNVCFLHSFGRTFYTIKPNDKFRMITYLYVKNTNYSYPSFWGHSIIPNVNKVQIKLSLCYDYNKNFIEKEFLSNIVSLL